jgi:hypothetical protein
MTTINLDNDMSIWLCDFMRTIVKASAPQKIYMTKFEAAMRRGEEAPEGKPSHASLYFGSKDYDYSEILYNMLKEAQMRR